MVEINNIIAQPINNGPVSSSSRSVVVKKEFMSMFYKEVLKNSFSGEFMGMEESNPNSQMTKDLFIEKIANELAEKDTAILPDDIKERIGEFK